MIEIQWMNDLSAMAMEEEMEMNPMMDDDDRVLEPWMRMKIRMNETYNRDRMDDPRMMMNRWMEIDVIAWRIPSLVDAKINAIPATMKTALIDELSMERL